MTGGIVGAGRKRGFGGGCLKRNGCREMVIG
jgi:hypothetical protein